MVDHEGLKNVARGDALLAAAQGEKTSLIKAKLAAFQTAQSGLAKADALVLKASAALGKAQQKVAEADVDQDEAVDALATALAGEGKSRTNPFSSFKRKGGEPFPAPAKLQRIAYGEEAKIAIELATVVSKAKDVSAASKGKASALAKAAKKVQDELAEVAKPEVAYKNALAARFPFEQNWETTFSALGRAARAAEDDGARGLHNALFGGDKVARKRPAKKAEPKSAKSAKAAPKSVKPPVSTKTPAS